MSSWSHPASATPESRSRAPLPPAYVPPYILQGGNSGQVGYNVSPDTRGSGVRWPRTGTPPIPGEDHPRPSRPATTRRQVRWKSSRLRTDIRLTRRSGLRELSCGRRRREAMRYYIGVDWADAAHAIWVLDDQGRGPQPLRPHTAEGSRSGPLADEQRASGAELWAAIERPDGRVVDFLLDHGVVSIREPKALDRARDRFRMNPAKSDPFDATCWRPSSHGYAQLHALQPSSEAAQELKLLTRGRPARPGADPAPEPTHRDAHRVLPRALEVCVTSPQSAQPPSSGPTRPRRLAGLTRKQWSASPAITAGVRSRGPRSGDSPAAPAPVPAHWCGPRVACSASCWPSCRRRWPRSPPTVRPSRISSPRCG